MEDWSNKKILIVEDELSNSLYINAILKKTNINTTLVDNGRDAVEMVKNNRFDVVLMDLKMPIMDGFEATKKIREFNPDIVIIAQTAYAFQREECMSLGFSDYVTKPYYREQILAILEKHFNYKESNTL
jgi:CheY-like chemotaxis protein